MLLLKKKRERIDVWILLNVTILVDSDLCIIRSGDMDLWSTEKNFDKITKYYQLVSLC